MDTEITIRGLRESREQRKNQYVVRDVYMRGPLAASCRGNSNGMTEASNSRASENFVLLPERPQARSHGTLSRRGSAIDRDSGSR